MLRSFLPHDSYLMTPTLSDSHDPIVSLTHHAYLFLLSYDIPLYY